MARRPQRAPHRPQPRTSSSSPNAPAPAPDDVHPTDELTRRRTRALNCAVFQADLQATADEHLQLLQLKRLVRLGHIPIADATTIVNELRTQQQQRAA